MKARPLPQDRKTLDLARRHVAEANARVARQRELIARLPDGGAMRDLAEQLLQSLVETAEQMKVHRDYLELSKDKP